MDRPKHAVVLVLGDVGRSPRMQYHALSLLENGHYVTLIGYAGEELIPPLEEALTPTPDGKDETCSYRGKLHIIRMTPYQPSKNNILCRILYYPLRLASLLFCLVYTFWVQLNHTCHTNLSVDVILVQNPPSVPTLILAYIYCIWNGIWRGKRPRLVIDWHNLGYTMFDLPGSQAPVLKKMLQHSLRAIVKNYECMMASLADAHLCVTESMEGWLGENFGVHGGHVRVLYDKPPLLFRPTKVQEQHDLFRKLMLEQNDGLSQWLNKSESDKTHPHNTKTTLFTKASIKKGKTTDIELRGDRPALLVSSTSWTPDEDFSILLRALNNLQALIDDYSNKNSTYPRVLVLVTGKGPQKAEYLPLLNEFNKTHLSIKIYTLWLEPVDYPKLLGCATLGISLHTSTSGLDLPMKVLDMFGCHVPVCALGFSCLSELVKDGINGRIFHTDIDLSEQLFELLEGYPNHDKGHIEKYRRNIRGMTRWKENWEECARHLVVG